MQWLIDIIKEYIATLKFTTLLEVEAQGYIKTSYVDRGDYPDWDFTYFNFVKDGQFHDLDLSTIVPAGAKAVHMLVWFKSSSVQKNVWFRKKGNVAAFNMAMSYTQIADFNITNDIIVCLDSNRKIQYNMSSSGVSEIRVIVRGWWL